MRFEIKRYGLCIEPQEALDVAYIEEVLKLKNDGDSCILKRKNASGLNCIAYLETKETPQETLRVWKPSCIAEVLTNSSDIDAPALLIEKLAHVMYKRMKWHEKEGPYNCSEESLINAVQLAMLSGNYTDVAIFAMYLNEIRNNGE
jgi:hypothetical protein